MIDLFAGSGALGIEALSRGARTAIFIESDARALSTIRRNLERFDVEAARGRVRRADAWKWVEKGPGAVSGEARVLFADPPYEDGVVERLLPAAAAWVQSALLDAAVLEHPGEAAIPALGDALRVRTRRHGRGGFTILERDVERPAPGARRGEPR